MFLLRSFGKIVWRPLCAIALVWPLFGSLLSARAATVFSITSSPQSWIGAGETILVGPEDGFSFSGTFDSDSIASFFIHNFDSAVWGSSLRWWGLDFGAPWNQSLTVGAYANAANTPWPPLASPGLNFEGNGRSNNTATGSFEIMELVADTDGNILSFAADFIQYDAGSDDGWNKGALRLNSDIPIAWLLPPPPLGRNFPPVDDPPLTSNPAPPDPVPGPLPVAAVLAGWSCSRQLRRRCRKGR